MQESKNVGKSTILDLLDTMVDLPDTMVYLPDTMVDLSDTMVDLPDQSTVIPRIWSLATLPRIVCYDIQPLLTAVSYLVWSNNPGVKLSCEDQLESLLYFQAFPDKMITAINWVPDLSFLKDYCSKAICSAIEFH